jgi:hypothetical protein
MQGSIRLSASGSGRRAARYRASAPTHTKALNTADHNTLSRLSAMLSRSFC